MNTSWQDVMRQHFAIGHGNRSGPRRLLQPSAKAACLLAVIIGSSYVTVLLPFGPTLYAGMDVLALYIAWHVPYIGDEDRRSILRDYRGCLRNLDQQPRLIVPQLDAFDPQLRPLQPSQASA